MSDTGVHRVLRETREELARLRALHEREERERGRVGWLARAINGIDAKSIVIGVLGVLGTGSGVVLGGAGEAAVESRVEAVYREQIRKAEASAERAWCFYGACRQGHDLEATRARCVEGEP